MDRAHYFRHRAGWPGITPGSGRAIVWNAGTDWNNLLSTTMRYRITADVRISGECAPATPSNA